MCADLTVAVEVQRRGAYCIRWPCGCGGLGHGKSLGLALSTDLSVTSGKLSLCEISGGLHNNGPTLRVTLMSGGKIPISVTAAFWAAVSLGILSTFVLLEGSHLCQMAGARYVISTIRTQRAD